MTEAKFDPAEAHKQFSAGNFNAAWELIEKQERSAEEQEQMRLLSMASIWHWTQRPDCTPQNLSIGYWQASRVHAISGLPDEARRFGNLCLENSQAEGVAPFALAYAYEALARAEAMAGNVTKRDEHIVEARKVMERMTDADMVKYLESDLATIP